ncbi:MAG: cellulose synthase subunit BcsC, partial [Planctomycetaceae bacterium]|nr:cellulose synthase subunit BcsC [Planctomycetaceae bacterium]
PWYRKSAVVWSLITAAVLACLGGWNYYVSQHRTLSVLNGLSTPISVQIDGLPVLEIGGNSRKDVIVPEGLHQAVVTQPPGQFPQSEFEVRSGWWERFFRSPVFIADPSQTAAVVWEQAVYSNFNGANDAENKMELRVGETFASFPHADYHFEEFPQQLQVKGGSRIIKSRVGLMHEPPASIVGGAFSLGREVGSLDPYMERHLNANPEDSDLLNAYIGIGAMVGKSESREKFLEVHLADRPVRIQWHRRYQDLFGRLAQEGGNRARFDGVVARYDQLLKQFPKDASLLYLRGRLEPHARGASPWIDQALEIDPKHAYATVSKAYTYLVQGKNAEALQWYERAATLRPDDTEINAGVSDARLAAQDFAGLERTLREALQKKPDNLNNNLELLRLLILTQRGNEAEQHFQALLGRIRPQQANLPQVAAIVARELELPYLYAKGDFETLVLKAKQAGPEAKEFEFMAAMERGQLMDVPQTTDARSLSFWHLCRAIVARRAGDAAQSMASKAAALAILDGKGGEEEVAAKLLRQGDKALWEDMEDLLMQPRFKTVLLVVLAQEAPQLKGQCLDLAEKLNHSLNFPYHMIQREIAQLRK